MVAATHVQIDSTRIDKYIGEAIQRRLVSEIISGTTTPSKDRSFVFRSQAAIIFITCAPRYRSPCLYLPKIYRLNIGLPPLINDATRDTENGA